MVAVEHAILLFVHFHIIVFFDFFSAKQFADFLRYNHKGLKTLLYFFGDSFEKVEAGGGFGCGLLKHFGPDFVGGAEKADTDGFAGRFFNFKILVVGNSLCFGLLANSVIKIFKVVQVESLGRVVILFFQF